MRNHQNNHQNNYQNRRAVFGRVSGTALDALANIGQPLTEKLRGQLTDHMNQLLEKDALYAHNIRRLLMGNPEPVVLTNCRRWLAAAALRRAGFDNRTANKAVQML